MPTLTKKEYNEAIETATCPVCGGTLDIQYENNGFTAPDPEHWEIVSVKCVDCGLDLLYDIDFIEEVKNE